MGCCQALQFDHEKKISIHTKSETFNDDSNPAAVQINESKVSRPSNNSEFPDSSKILILPDESNSFSLNSWKEFSKLNKT